MRWPTLALCAFVLCGFTPEHGDVSGWSFVRSLPIDAPLHGVGAAHTPLPVRDGSSSIRFEVRPGDCSRAKHGWNDCLKDRERTELKQSDYQYHGETWWYRFSLFVPRGHENIWPAKLSFAQFHQEGAKPVIMFQNHSGGLWLDIHDAKRTVQLIELIPQSNLQDRWHDVTLQIKWSQKTDGFIRAWINGKTAADFSGVTMTAAKVYFKFGLYRSHLKRNRSARQITHRAYFDRLVRGKTEAEVK